MGGNPTKLSFATREYETVCSRVSEAHPLPIDMWALEDDARNKAEPLYLLSVLITRSRSGNALSVVKKACIGSKSCSLGVSINVFGDPCIGVTKSLAVNFHTA
ncbi:Beta-galactosidase 8 [Datura stramonium]|uniref:Beta-galactosidase 8 n=1 Tax=Datura stramonium TaxID=4076 RepID=A0ABS8SEX2_DATST|nr:Beta-galactosidase 8 [Datura stramonium]